MHTIACRESLSAYDGVKFLITLLHPLWSFVTSVGGAASFLPTSLLHVASLISGLFEPSLSGFLEPVGLTKAEISPSIANLAFITETLAGSLGCYNLSRPARHLVSLADQLDLIDSTYQRPSDALSRSQKEIVGSACILPSQSGSIRRK